VLPQRRQLLVALAQPLARHARLHRRSRTRSKNIIVLMVV
jgi:hypothetical protein